MFADIVLGAESAPTHLAGAGAGAGVSYAWLSSVWMGIRKKFENVLFDILILD